MDTVQRRSYSRVHFHGDAFLQAGCDEWPCEVIDLSLRGALIEIDIPAAGLDVDTPCLLALRLGDDIDMRMAGRVAHRHGKRLGIACAETDVDSFSHLRRLLALNLGDTGLLGRELSELISN
ncbi:hypothetical protein FACS1894116_02740 [Betaproteobacteria bacterium]|nr:hypothetical protein AGMMS49543_22100 [Betaproteobacteria bacterium]GHT92476.1 hypothetical protein FACS1894116_02740 [Betaproteobacteria bacterium]GHT99196.1 hypothetical protein FACS1894154_05840 [Betaproteobacteria bacterium]GHU23019.1 hypothetical protein AGMMS50243_23680 [Betaproteobacteria bacterium]